MSGAVENCPFCGSDEVGLFLPSDYRTGANNRDWYVQCFGCHVETAEYLTEAEAVTAWNTRTTPPARSYADGLAVAAKHLDERAERARVAAIGGGMDPLDAELLDYEYSNAAAAIRLLSQGEKA